MAEAARRYGYEDYYTDWHDLVADDRVTLVDNGAAHGSHAIDLARFLVGEPRSVAGQIATVNRRRPAADGSGQIVDVSHCETAHALIDFENGAVGSLEVSFVAPGRKEHLALEVNGTEGSLTWDLEDLNRLRVYLRGRDKVPGIAGFEDVLATEASHPTVQYWWPPGHVLGWESLHTRRWPWLLGRRAERVARPDGAHELRVSEVALR